MKIGIISDTHSKIELAKEALDLVIKNGAEFIIHAGDIVRVEMLEMLKSSGLKYVAVYGNNDAHLAPYHSQYNLVQEPHYFKLSNIKFKLMHLPFYMAPDAEVIIFGHTHEFEVDFKNNTLFLNSGEVCARSKNISECAMLEVSDDLFLVTHYTKETKTKKKATFKEKNFSFKRDR